MERWLADQTVIFLWAVVLGLALGLLYDVEACLCRVAGCGRVGRGVADLLYCALGLGLFLLFLLLVGGGEVRSYTLMGCGLGLVGWGLALSRPTRWLLLPCMRAVRRGLGGCRRALLRAFSAPRGN